MKKNKVRKGIVMLVVAAASAVSMVGAGSSTQAFNTPQPTVKVVQADPSGRPVPNSFGSVWM